MIQIMVRISLFTLFFAVFAPGFVKAQGFQVIFPGLSGNDLIDSVAANYRPSVVLDYANARDTLYASILAAADDSVRCIYSGHTVYLDPTQDPTQYVYQNGAANGINAEHSYPQSKGADVGTNAHSDMHHLYPTRIALNDARGDKPYAEIPDAQTQKWFVNNQVFTSIPTQHIEWYAESNNNAFEPREAVKGDLARSILYFYTVYRSQANAADPAFFEQQRTTLCQWNAMDPADPKELAKTWKIASYQDGKPNPYVVDCTLASRTWCPQVAPGCFTSAVHDLELPVIAAQIVPNPASVVANLLLDLPFAGDVQARLISLLGQEVAVFQMANAPAGEISWPIDASGLVSQGSWMGFLEITVQGTAGKARRVLPFVVNP
jgi:endonuclease I